MKFNDTEAYQYAISYRALYDSMMECTKCTKWKYSTSYFMNNALIELTKLRRDLISGKYRMLEPNKFIIHEPKERLIQSIYFKDRVFQKSLCTNVLAPAIVPTLVYDNGANVKGKGYSFSIDRLKRQLHSYYISHGSNEGYVLKCDISKYFDSIDHNILYNILCKYFVDSNVLFYLRDSINKYGFEGVGIGLGSQINQLLALLYLNGMDHFIKEQLHIKYYGRYMDDFYLIHEDKEYLKECKHKISEYISTNLNLTLSERKTQLYTTHGGFIFIGFRHVITDTGKVYSKILQKSIQREKKKLQSLYRVYSENRMSIDDVRESYRSWRAHLMRGDSYKIIKMMDDIFYKIFGVPFEE